jgi:hypothetical protein
MKGSHLFWLSRSKGMHVDIWIRDYNPPRCFQKKISGRGKHKAVQLQQTENDYRLFQTNIPVRLLGPCSLLSEWRSIKINGRNQHQRWSPLRWWVRFPVKPIPHVIERATLSDSVGFLRELQFPPTYITNCPILSMVHASVLFSVNSIKFMLMW